MSYIKVHVLGLTSLQHINLFILSKIRDLKL